MAEQQLSAQQRAQLFAMSTRQNFQMLNKESAATTPATLTFELPKARLLSHITLLVKAKINVKASSPSVQGDYFDMYKVIRRLSLDLNNGFQPYVLSGEELLMHQLVDLRPVMDIVPVLSQKTAHYNKTYTASTDGTDNEVEFIVNLPITINERDPISLILLQNDQTNVRLTVDLSNGSDIFEGNSAATAEVKDVSIQCMLTTFSIPKAQAAFPDLSVLKLVMGRNDALPTAGNQTIKLTTGQIYRKIIFRVLDENGLPVDDTFFNGTDIQLKFNQADVNYSITADMLRAVNTKALGIALPKGMFCFDFSQGGTFSNLGGSRDLIDSGNLQELWLCFNTEGRGRVHIVTETLSRLQ